MNKLIHVVSLCLLFAASLAIAEVSQSFRAYIVSVDAGKKTITFRVPDDAKPPKWSEWVATWNDATVWQRAPDKIYKKEPATVALVASLKKDTKVYAGVNDGGSNGQSWTIESLTTMPPDSTVP
ncbi:MAG: hypothetical protein ABI843_15215 [Dokdonella sp.]